MLESELYQQKLLLVFRHMLERELHQSKYLHGKQLFEIAIQFEFTMHVAWRYMGPQRLGHQHLGAGCLDSRRMDAQ